MKVGERWYSLENMPKEQIIYFSPIEHLKYVSGMISADVLSSLSHINRHFLEIPPASPLFFFSSEKMVKNRTLEETMDIFNQKNELKGPI